MALVYLPINQALNTDTKYDLAILKIWNNKDTLETTLYGAPSCSHFKAKELKFNICTDCGAHIFQLGQEENPLDYFKHLYHIINQINAKSIIVETDRYYPADYSAINLPGSLKTYIGNFTGIDRVSNYFYLGTKADKRQVVRHFSYYTDEVDFLKEWENKVVSLRNTFSLVHLFPMHTKTLFINPESSDIAFGLDGIDYVTPNSSINLMCSSGY